MNKNIKKYFPQASRKGEVYLDSASTTLKVQSSIDRVSKFYLEEVSNVHRGLSHLSSQSTANYENVREKVAQFLSSQSSDEIVFTRSVTDGMNFLASVLADKIQPGDEILLTQMEHHSNYFPWMELAKKRRAKVRLIPITSTGELNLSQLDALLNEKTKILSLVHQSNAIGTVNPIESILKLTSTRDIISIVDAAQSVSTISIDVRQLGCDFLLFSGHKLFAPSGVGVIYGKKSSWKQLPPYQTGGGMIAKHDLSSIWADPPHKFEAGTPPIEGVLGLGASIDFLNEHISFNDVANFEKYLLEKTESFIRSLDGFRVIGTSPSRINTLSFVSENIHSDDLCTLLGEQNIAVRSGDHCCRPLMNFFNLPSGTVRVSFSIYNTEEDVSIFIKGLTKAVQLLKKNKKNL